MAASVDGAVPATVEEETLVQLSRQKHRSPPLVIFAALIVAVMAAPTSPAWAVWGWLFVVVVVQGLRYRFFARVAAHAELPVGRRLREAVVLSAASGVAFSLSLFFTAALGPFERIVQTLLILGLCTGAVATTTGYGPVFLAFMLPCIGALAVAWSAGGLLGAPTYVEGGFAVLDLFFGAMLVAMARDTHKLFAESFNMRSQQSDMNARLRDALRLAEAASTAKTRFLASASHDLRQPMHTLSLFAEALWLRPLDGTTRGIAAHMREALLSLGTQLDALLDISKLDAQVVDVRRVPVDLGLVLGRLHQQYAPEAARRNLVWRLRTDGRAMCSTDPLLVERILRNLIDNAFKYTVEGEISLTVSTVGNERVIRITDSGCGISPEEQERVFEEFYQVGNAERDRAHGLGLGLSIVKRLCELLSIRLALRSTLGAGTTLELAVAAIEHASTVPMSTPASRSVDGLHVLVIDDEEPVRAGMRSLLDELGCSCDLVASTEGALHAAALKRPDIAIADFRLRGTDNGVLAVQRLRSLLPGLPSLLLSGDTAPARLAEAQRAGIPMLHKPVTLDPLLQAIQDELSKRPALAHEGEP